MLVSPLIRKAVCPGSFDPVTNGHLDIISRAVPLYDEVVVAVLINKTKSSFFTVDERIEMLSEATAGYGNVRVDSFHGLLVDYCRANEIPVIVKGMRPVGDFDYELQMAQMNRGLTGLETMFMPTNAEYSFIASSLVKEVATYGGDVSRLLPENVHKQLIARVAQRREAAEGAR
jgi:pantetheine-phosphate adenylyltransferase